MLSSLDLTVIGIYAIVLLSVALYVSTRKITADMSSEDYFLAGKSLPWWAIGASLIAANISAEQIIGQSGQGFVVGLAIAAYEWQAAIVLLIVAKYFLPIFLEKKIYTMPQFLELRFGNTIKSMMAIFWVVLYTAVNLTAVLWLGGLALTALTGWNVVAAMMGLAAFAVIYSLYGGLKAVALTDIIQVVVLIAGGFAITGIVLSLVGDGAGIFAGLGTLMGEIPGHFEMILAPENPSYNNLPGIWTLLGGLWVLHFSYWGFNQYIIQRALGAESLAEAQKGLAFAAALEIANSDYRRHSGHCRALSGARRAIGYGAFGGQPRLDLWHFDGSCAGRPARSGVCRADCGDCLIAGLHDEFHLNHFHHGYLSRPHRAGPHGSALCHHWPPHLGRRHYHCGDFGASRFSAAWKALSKPFKNIPALSHRALSRCFCSACSGKDAMHKALLPC